MRNTRFEIQCHEYDGFGHIQSECTNTLKKNNKPFTTRCSDGDSDRSGEDEDHVSNNVALTTCSAAKKTSYEDFPQLVSQQVPKDAQHDDHEDVPTTDIVMGKILLMKP